MCSQLCHGPLAADNSNHTSGRNFDKGPLEPPLLLGDQSAGLRENVWKQGGTLNGAKTKPGCRTTVFAILTRKGKCEEWSEGTCENESKVTNKRVRNSIKSSQDCRFNTSNRAD